jgi:hypothetical protein
MSTARTAMSSTSPPVLVVLTWAMLWGFGMGELEPRLPDRSTSVEELLPGLQGDAVWRSSWSEQFPGCVALALWPRDEQPHALVVRTLQGSVAQVAPGHGDPQDRVIGACR